MGITTEERLHNYYRYGRRYDRQRSKLYKAENTVDGIFFQPTYLASIAGCQQFVDRIVRKRWFQRNFNIKKVTVHPKRNNAYARGGYGNVWLPRWARTEMVILHELSHVVTLTQHEFHGPEYAGTYIYLVEKVIGEDKARELTEAFRAYGVDWTFTHIKNR